MFKKILIAAGLQAAPSPIGKYLSAVVLFGVTPVALFLAYRNREQLAELVGAVKREVPQLKTRPLANGSVEARI